MSAPQVKVVDGKIVVNKDSLYATRDVEEHKMDIVTESSEKLTSSSFRKRTSNERWSLEETELFYKALSMCGTDFSMVAHFFPKKTRAQIKNKYKRSNYYCCKKHQSSHKSE